MERVAFVTHRGKRILNIDYSGLDTLSDLENVARHASELMAKEPPGSVLAITDLRDVPYALRWVRRLGEIAISNASRVRARALVGVPSGAHPALAELVALSGTHMRAFDDIAPAMEWLAQQQP
jgi:hypothetical protein